MYLITQGAKTSWAVVLSVGSRSPLFQGMKGGAKELRLGPKDGHDLIDALVLPQLLNLKGHTAPLGDRLVVIVARGLANHVVLK